MDVSGTAFPVTIPENTPYGGLIIPMSKGQVISYSSGLGNLSSIRVFFMKITSA